MFKKDLIEVVRTGDVYSVFVLKTNSFFPEKVTESVSKVFIERVIEKQYPNAKIVDTNTFVDEVQKRLYQIIL